MERERERESEREPEKTQKGKKEREQGGQMAIGARENIGRDDSHFVFTSLA